MLEAVSDMSGSFAAAAQEHFPQADLTVDWFHVVQLFTTAVEEVRRAESRERALPKGTRWGVLKGRETAKTQTQAEALQELASEAFATGIVYRVKEQLRWIRQDETSHTAKWQSTNSLNYVKEFLADKLLLKPVTKTLKTFEKHLDRILFRWCSWHTNARLEGLSGLFQAARARARGYRNITSFITMIYLIAVPIADFLAQ